MAHHNGHLSIRQTCSRFRRATSVVVAEEVGEEVEVEVEEEVQGPQERMVQRELQELPVRMEQMALHLESTTL